MKWDIAEFDAAFVPSLGEQLGISPFLASLLVVRGVAEPERATAFLNPRLSEFSDPSALPGVEVAAERLCRAIGDGEKVLIYGDYDVDGITSICLLLTFLKDVGLSASYTVPSRFKDGYGLNMARAAEIVEGGYDLLITVDCGSSSVEEVEYLQGHGVDVIVTDHHRLHGERPPALAFLNPLDWPEDDRFDVLAGVGVAFLLVMAVYIRLKGDPETEKELPSLKDYLDLVTIGTVADMVPLTGINRSLVVNGLKLLTTTPTRPGVVALKEVSGVGDRRVDASSIAFYMAPRLNAAGRLGSAETGVVLLMSGDIANALALARQLDQTNRDRRELENRIFDEADHLLAVAFQAGNLNTVVLASPHWHQGVLGIVASRLCEKYHRPTVLFCIDEDVATGSARSIRGFNIAAALEANEDLLIKHGGHAMAAGLTVQAGTIDELRARLDAVVEGSLTEEELEASLQVDLVVDLAAVTSQTVSDLDRLSPFGSGNPEPVLATRGVKVVSSRFVGGGQHLKLVVEQDGRKLEAIGYRMGGCTVSRGDTVDIAYHPEMRTWQGLTSLQLRLRDVRQQSAKCDEKPTAP